MREEIKKLKTEPVIFQTNKCTQCVKKLNLPAVHLLCKHSWHQQVCVKVRGGGGGGEHQQVCVKVRGGGGIIID